MTLLKNFVLWALCATAVLTIFVVISSRIHPAIVPTFTDVPADLWVAGLAWVLFPLPDFGRFPKRALVPYLYVFALGTVLSVCSALIQGTAFPKFQATVEVASFCGGTAAVLRYAAAQRISAWLTALDAALIGACVGGVAGLSTDYFQHHGYSFSSERVLIAGHGPSIVYIGAALGAVVALLWLFRPRAVPELRAIRQEHRHLKRAVVIARLQVWLARIGVVIGHAADTADRIKRLAIGSAAIAIGSGAVYVLTKHLTYWDFNGSWSAFLSLVWLGVIVAGGCMACFGLQFAWEALQPSAGFTTADRVRGTAKLKDRSETAAAFSPSRSPLDEKIVDA